MNLIDVTPENIVDQGLFCIKNVKSLEFAKKKDMQEVLSPPVGQSIVLAAGVQGLNNARAVFTGSIDMFSNELYYKR